MRPLSALIVLTAVALGVGIAAYQYRTKHEDAPTPATQVSPIQDSAHQDSAPQNGTGHDDGVPAEPNARKGLSKPKTSTPKASSTKRVTLSNATVEKIRTELRNWEFNHAGSVAMDPNLDQDHKRLLAEWRVKKAWSEEAKKLEPTLPESLHRIDLQNGRSLWAKEIQEGPKGYEVKLLGGNIGATLAADRVKKTQQVTVYRYLQETREDYEAKLAELRAGSRTSLTQAFALALKRGDNRRLPEIYTEWVAKNGPAALSGLAKTADSAEISLAVDWLTAKKPSPALASTTETRTPDLPEVAKPKAPRRPSIESLADLSSKLRKVRRKVTPRLSQKQRDKYIEQLNDWEVWLSAQTAERDQQLVRELQRSLQLTRFDLLKMSEF